MYRTERDHTAGFTIGVISGAVVGAGLALLFAPKSGAAFRSNIAESVEPLRAAIAKRYQDLADRAGVGPASLYRYFPNLGAVYAELARYTQRQFLEMIKLLVSQRDLPTEQGIEMMCRLAIALPRHLRRKVDLDVPFAWSEHHAVHVFDEAIEVITAWLRSRLPSPPADLRQRVFLMLAYNRGIIILSAMMPDAAPDDDEAVRHMVLHAKALVGLDRPGSAL